MSTRKSNFKKDPITFEEFIDDMAFIFYKYSGSKFSKMLGLHRETLRRRALKTKEEQHV